MVLPTMQKHRPETRRRAPHQEGVQFTSARFAFGATIFGTEPVTVASRTSGITVSLTISALTGATFISPSRARTSAVKAGIGGDGGEVRGLGGAKADTGIRRPIHLMWR